MVYRRPLTARSSPPAPALMLGADTIDYQKPYKAAGLDKSIPWYQVIGNHDQFWMGSAFENTKPTQAHVGGHHPQHGSMIQTRRTAVNETGAYMGVVDGSTPYGDIIGAGPEEDFPTPPRSLPTRIAARSRPADFHDPELDERIFQHDFEPGRSRLHPGQPRQRLCLLQLRAEVGYADQGHRARRYLQGTAPDRIMPRGCLDQHRLDWLKSELQEGQDDGKLMIIAAHIPIKPQADLTDSGTLFTASPRPRSSVTAVARHPPQLSESHPVDLGASSHEHRDSPAVQRADLDDHPEQSFWEVETASLRDFPQQFRTFDIRRNSDNTISIIVTDVDPAVSGRIARGKVAGVCHRRRADIWRLRPHRGYHFPCLQCRAGETIDPRNAGEDRHLWVADRVCVKFGLSVI